MLYVIIVDCFLLVTIVVINLKTVLHLNRKIKLELFLLFAIVSNVHSFNECMLFKVA